MNKTIFLFLIGLLAFSCADESLNPLPEITNTGGLVKAVQVKPLLSSNNIRFNNPDAVVIEIELTDPSGTVDSYTLKGRVAPFVASSLSFEGTTYPIKTVSSFPATIQVTATELAAAFGLTPQSFTTSQSTWKRFQFHGTSVSDGITVDINQVVGSGFDIAEGEDKPEQVAPYLYSKVIFLRN